MSAPLETSIAVERGFSLERSFVLQRTGRGDPTAQLSSGRFVKASRTPEGLVTVELLELAGEGQVVVRAFGDGAGYAVARAAAWVRGRPDLPPFVPPPGPLAKAASEHRALVLPRCPFPGDLHLSLILQQRVTYAEAVRSHHQLARRYGERAPGPFELVVFPDYRALRAVPSHEFRRLGVDEKRRVAMLEAARLRERIDRLEELEALRRYLLAIPGTGPWTAENLLAHGFGDADAVPPGDVHLPHQVCFALAGEPYGSDERMFELLEPYRPHRARIVRLVWMAGPTRPYLDKGPPR